ncbi:MAG: hypothetical protein IT294_08910 [Deltaproteobacteria bacterium]|nr:hypothetical protein [Deltaproteobacteria bacterium]
METIVSFAAAWWAVGLGVGGAAVAGALLWRWALEDLVLSAVDLPACERSAPDPQALSRPNATPAR